MQSRKVSFPRKKQDGESDRGKIKVFCTRENVRMPVIDEVIWHMLTIVKSIWRICMFAILFFPLFCIFEIFHKKSGNKVRAK